MDDVFASGPAQAKFDIFDHPKSFDPDIGEIRAELLAILETLKMAVDQCPYDERTLRYHRKVFPQMAKWLPDEEGTRLVAAFHTEMERLQRYD